MENFTPIVTIHKGNNKYLHYCLLQAKKMNPNSRIILIGDDSNKDCLDFVEHYNINDLNCPQIEEFLSIYDHMSDNPYEFELICILRWFYLRNLMKKLNLQSCFHIDSDVMLYCNITEECKKFADYVLTVDYAPNKIVSAPHNIFINGFDIIDNFCQFTVDFYKDKEQVEEFRKRYNNSPSTAKSNFSDMNLWYLYPQTLDQNKVLNFTNIIDGCKFDHNIIAEPVFEKDGYSKKIKFIKGIPYSKYIGEGEYHNKLIQFKSLHFQGIGKCYMKYAYRYNIISKWILTEYKITRELLRLRNKIFNIKELKVNV